MAGTPKWRGQSALQERPSSPILETSEQGTRWIRVFEGPYATCLAERPAREASYSDLPGYKVDSTRVEKAPGNRGVLTVTLLGDAFVTTSSSTEGIPDPVPEIEWVEVQKKLEVHKRYRAGGAKQLSEMDLQKINAWRNTTTFTERVTAYVELTDNAKDFVGKVQAGVESWNAYAPVARLTSYSTTKPTTGGCGTKGNPPSPLLIAGYEYVKTADRAVKNGRRWERVQEWQGAESVDEDLYPT